MFKAMFQNENRIKYSCKLLSYLLDIPYAELLKTLRLGKNEMDKKLEIEKSERCDYIAYISGMAVNIEINCNKDVVMMERNIEYMNRLYSRKVKKGEKLDYTQVIQININNFAFQGIDEIVDVYYLQNKNHIILNEKIVVGEIFIPNLRKKWYTEGVESLNEFERYLLTLIEQDIDSSKELSKGDELMEEFVEEAVKASEDGYLGEAYDKEWALKEWGRQEGHEEGYAEGHEDGKREIVLKMLEEKLTLDIISRIANLSKEEIMKIKLESN